MNSVLDKAVSLVMPTAVASGRFKSFCTIQQPDGVLVDAGQPSGMFVDVPGLVKIRCMAPPESSVRITANEVKTQQNIQTFSDLHILLDGWYPLIETGVVNGWKAIIDGQQYDIMGAESSSQDMQTRMVVRFSGL